MNEPIPELLQDLLDRGVDPLDDPRARDWLLDHPEALESFAMLRARLAELRRAPAPVPRTPARNRMLRPRLWLPAAGLAAGLLWLLVTALGGGVKRPESSPLPRPDFARSARVVRFTTLTTVEGQGRFGHGSSFRSVVTAGNAAAQRRARFVVRIRPSPIVLVCATTVSTEENTPR